MATAAQIVTLLVAQGLARCGGDTLNDLLHRSAHVLLARLSSKASIQRQAVPAQLPRAKHEGRRRNAALLHQAGEVAHPDTNVIGGVAGAQPAWLWPPGAHRRALMQ